MRWFMIGVVSVVLFCSREGEKKDNSEVIEGEQELKRIHLVETRGVSPSFELWAKKVIKREDTTLTIEFKVFFYDSLGLKTAELTADSGWIDERTFNLIARHNVVLTTEKGERLETSELFWIDREKSVQSSTPVTLYQGDNVIKGKGLVSEPNLKGFKILGRVEGRKK